MVPPLRAGYGTSEVRNRMRMVFRVSLGCNHLRHARPCAAVDSAGPVPFLPPPGTSPAPRLGAFGAATLLALSAVACSPRSRAAEPSATATSPDRPAPVSPTLHPAWPPASSFPTRWPIKHVVFLIKENRTFDNLFGTFPGVNGAATANDDGTIRPLVRGTDGRLPGDLPHCYVCALQAWNYGRMDGFDQGGLTTKWAFT